MIPRSPIIYFHGMPGSPRELNLFGRVTAGDAIYAPDRNKRNHRSAPNELDALAAMIQARHSAGQVRIIAFSLGALPALRVAARLGPLVACLDLVSPAAPLETGEYHEMAGGPVFRLAKRSPRLFSQLVGLQALAARYAGSVLYAGLFATARGADRDIMRRRHFRTTMMMVLADCFADGAIKYRTEIQGYVTPWTSVLAEVEQPVTLWHGEADNWGPCRDDRRTPGRLAQRSRCSSLSWSVSLFNSGGRVERAPRSPVGVGTEGFRYLIMLNCRATNRST